MHPPPCNFHLYSLAEIGRCIVYVVVHRDSASGMDEQLRSLTLVNHESQLLQSLLLDLAVIAQK